MKKNYFLKWLTAVLCSVCCLSLESAQNLVPNPGFEEGTGDTFVNWSKFNGADALVETSVANEVQDGKRALKAIVSADGNAYDVQLVSDAIPTVIGQSYTFTIYVKGAVGVLKYAFLQTPMPCILQTMPCLKIGFSCLGLLRQMIPLPEWF